MKPIMKPDGKKWQAIKQRTQTLLKAVPTREGRVLSFETGELLSDSSEIPSFSKQEIPLRATGTGPISRDVFSPRSKDRFKPALQPVTKTPRISMHQWKWIGIAIMFFSFFLFIAINESSAAALKVRKPQGEFSALVESKLTRDNFKSDKAMKKFIKQKDKQYEDKSRK